MFLIIFLFLREKIKIKEILCINLFYFKRNTYIYHFCLMSTINYFNYLKMSRYLLVNIRNV